MTLDQPALSECSNALRADGDLDPLRSGLQLVQLVARVWISEMWSGASASPGRRGPPSGWGEAEVDGVDRARSDEQAAPLTCALARWVLSSRPSVWGFESAPTSSISSDVGEPLPAEQDLPFGNEAAAALAFVMLERWTGLTLDAEALLGGSEPFHRYRLP